MEKDKIQIKIRENRSEFNSGKRVSVSYRRDLLKKLLTKIVASKGEIISALDVDLHRSEEDTLLVEYIPLIKAIKFFIRNLKSLSSPKRFPISIMNFPASGRLMPEPYGEVLIFGTWNFPLLLSLEPVVGAIAAGNKVVIKLSDKTPKTTALIAWILKECFSEDDLIVVQNELSMDDLLDEKFDYIFFTGGMNAGRHVMKRAGEKLTPVTVELGGKNPCIVDESASFRVAAKRIAWAKFINSGQCCLAPDYLLVNRKVKDKFLIELRKAIREMYGDDPANNPNYSRIVNVEHYDRIGNLLENGRLITGGDKNPQRLCIAPTVIDGITWDDKIMQNEIFGPILPILEYTSESDLFSQLTCENKPLALYYFGSNSKLINKLCNQTSSGSVSINDAVMQFVNENMPFGGVGSSGYGAYHGKYTFNTFTHMKPIMKKVAFLDIPGRYPPFSKLNKWFIKIMSK